MYNYLSLCVHMTYTYLPKHTVCVCVCVCVLRVVCVLADS
jgi:hypothetical protein